MTGDREKIDRLDLIEEFDRSLEKLRTPERAQLTAEELINVAVNDPQQRDALQRARQIRNRAAHPGRGGTPSAMEVAGARAALQMADREAQERVRRVEEARQRREAKAAGRRHREIQRELKQRDEERKRQQTAAEAAQKRLAVIEAAKLLPERRTAEQQQLVDAELAAARDRRLRWEDAATQRWRGHPLLRLPALTWTAALVITALWCLRMISKAGFLPSLGLCAGALVSAFLIFVSVAESDKVQTASEQRTELIVKILVLLPMWVLTWQLQQRLHPGWMSWFLIGCAIVTAASLVHSDTGWGKEPMTVEQRLQELQGS